MRACIFFDIWYQLVSCFLLFLILGTANAVEKQECAIHDPDSLFKNKLLTPNNHTVPVIKANLSCNVSAFSAYNALKKHHTLLVDIRSKQQFQEFSIPNSINIP